MILAGKPAYVHFAACEPYLAKVAAAERAQKREWQHLWRTQRANLPVDPEGIGDLGGYIRRFGRSEENAAGLALCEQFAASCPAVPPTDGFTVCGFQGTGKTTLIQAFARGLVAAGTDLRFEVAPELYASLLDASRREDLEGEFRRLCAFKVLVIDDLGREKPTPWWVDQVLFPLIDHRYRHGRPVICTTNYDWDRLRELYASARNEREQAHSAAQLIDRLQHRSAAVPFGGRVSHRIPTWGFVELD